MTRARTFHGALVLLAAVGALGCTEATVPTQSGSTPPADTVPTTTHVDTVSTSPPPGEDYALRGIRGAYEIEARITDFDPAWGDLTGYEYVAVLTFRASNAAAGGQIGTFDNFYVIDANGVAESSVMKGTIVRQSYGFDLVGKYFHWTAVVESIAEPVGVPATSPSFEGRFGTGGHIAGRFTATRIAGQ